ncbi:MAG: BPTD_3080 family restriction endonuclease [Streptosporangiaceae bacterium]
MADLSNPIINSPYDPPESHFEIGTTGPTGRLVPGRRTSESYIPVPVSRKGRQTLQEAFDFDVTGERREQNTLINDIRREVERWRANNWNGVTPYTRKLLAHWAARPPDRDEPVLFCQREAAETAIFLSEVAGRHGTADYRRRLEPENRLHNDGLPRVALKMATGTGKTVVMAMIIAWQTINKVMTPNDARFAKRFLVVAPGITIRDRLGVLHPERDDNYYLERDLVPPDLWDALLQAQVEIINYHAFLPRDSKEIQGVAANTRKLLRGGKPEEVDAFRETPDMVAARIMRAFGTGKGEVIVLNDEAHHCYQDKLLDSDTEADSEDRERNRDARVWFRGLCDLRHKAGIKTVYDLSATPYYLKGSGYNEGFIFPWVVSDFSLMDAIESGIVKIPRIPVDDDAAGSELVYLQLWDHIQPPLPKRRSLKPRDVGTGPQGWVMPEVLEGALRSLYRSYEQNYARYEASLAALGEPPPVLIVVCPNTIVSKLVFDWIAGRDAEWPDGTKLLVPGNLKLLSNVGDGNWTTRQRTILIDSEQLESGEPLGADFRKAAAREIEAFKQTYRLRNPGADVDKITDADLLREAMNTIGKKDKLGEHIRCVVSVAMLTEGWDANTVSHILGVRPFRSQLLCEQVVGRGLRRRNYAASPETGRFEPEYAEVYGVPFAFIPGDRQIPKPKDPRPAVEVRALPGRWDLAIRFPKLDGYRVELPDETLHADFDAESRMHLDQATVALWVRNQGVIGAASEVDLDDIRNARAQRIAFAIAKTLIQREEFFAALGGAQRPWLFPQLADIARSWLGECVTTDSGVTKGHLLLTQAGARAAEKVFSSIIRHPGSRQPVLMPIIRRFDPVGSTDDVRFVTRKVVIDPPPTKSHLNHVVLDGVRGNSWEEGLARALENNPRVKCYVKNERLGFTIPYVYEGRTHEYVPDFLVRLVTEPEDVERTLIIEVSGSRKSPGPTAAKADTARNQWCAAVNNWGEFGRWGYVEVHNPADADPLLRDAIDNLYADRPIIGLPA